MALSDRWTLRRIGRGAKPQLHGGYALTRVREGEDETWLLVKRRDDLTDAVNRQNG